VVDVFWLALSLTAFAVLLKLRNSGTGKKQVLLPKKKDLKVEKQVEAEVL
jgi:hypothetical protein